MPARLTTVDRQSVDYWQWAVMVVAPNQLVDSPINQFSFFLLCLQYLPTRTDNIHAVRIIFFHSKIIFAQISLNIPPNP